MSKRNALSYPPAVGAGQALAVAGFTEPWLDPEWQRLWLSITARPWRSLGVIPAGVGAPRELTLQIALTLSRTGMVHLGRPIQVADATDIPLSELNSLLSEISRYTGEGNRILVALPDAQSSPITTSIAQSLDAALLCVLVERMSSADAKKTIKAVGQSRFLGSVMLHDHQLAAVAASARK